MNLRLCLVWSLVILTTSTAQAKLTEAERARVNEIRLALNANEEIEKRLDQEDFNLDYQSVRKLYPGNLRRQYQILLAREYMVTLFESAYHYKTIAGQTDFSDFEIYAGNGMKPNFLTKALKYVSIDLESGKLPGLAAKSRDFGQILKTQNFDFKNLVESWVEISTTLEANDKEIQNGIAKLHEVRKDKSQAPAIREAQEQRIVLEVGVRQFWINQLVEISPVVSVLLQPGPVDPQQPFFKDLLTLFTAHMKLQKLKGLGPKEAYAEALQKLVSDVKPHVVRKAEELLKSHLAAMSLALSRGFGLTFDGWFFIRHNRLRVRTLERLKIAAPDQIGAIENIDHEIAQEEGFEKKDLLPAAGEELGKIALQWIAHSINFPMAVSYNVANAFMMGGRHHGTKDALGFGSQAGLNDLESFRLIQRDPMVHGLAMGLFDAFRYALPVLKFGSALNAPGRIAAWMKALPARTGSLSSVPVRFSIKALGDLALRHSSSIGWAAANSSASLAILTGGELMQRKGRGLKEIFFEPSQTVEDIKELWQNPHFQLNFWTALICDATLGFYAAEGRYVDVVWTMAAASGFSSFLAQVKMGQEVDWHRVNFDYAYVGTISVYKMRKVFAPGGARAVDYANRLLVGRPGAQLLATASIRFAASFASNLIGNPAYTFVTRQIMEEPEFFRQVDESIYDELSRMEQP
ncbi:MAG: hypothetical protein IT289_00755 [Oligoflexia bacterium]|nr:hypothetical protein [Oligoflexia bacterium]